VTSASYSNLLPWAGASGLRCLGRRLLKSALAGAERGVPATTVLLTGEHKALIEVEG